MNPQGNYGFEDDCDCQIPEVEALFCELLSDNLTPQRAQEIRARIAECQVCVEQLQAEELMRQLMRRCENAAAAPETLRQRITIQIRTTRTEYRF